MLDAGVEAEAEAGIAPEEQDAEQQVEQQLRRPQDMEEVSVETVEGSNSSLASE